MKGASALRRIRARRERRLAERAARRVSRPRAQLPPMIDSPAEFARAMLAAGVRSSIAFDERGNAIEVEIDRDRFAAAIERMESDPPMLFHVDDLDEADGDDSDDGSPAGDDDCPICRALRESAIGPPRRAWAVDD